MPVSRQGLSRPGLHQQQEGPEVTDWALSGQGSVSTGGGGLVTCYTPLPTGTPDEGLVFPKARHKDASSVSLEITKSLTF